MNRLAAYNGSKYRERRRYLDLIAETARAHGRRTFLSPFLGMGGVEIGAHNIRTENGRHAQLKRIIVGDLHDRVCNLFYVLQSRNLARELFRKVYWTAAGQSFLDLACEPTDDPAEDAYRFFIRQMLAHSKSDPATDEPVMSVIYADDGGNNPARRLNKAFRNLHEWARTIRAGCWQIRNLDWFEFRAEALAKKDRGQYMWFLDPPYHPDGRHKRLYSHEVDAEWYDRFLPSVLNLPGSVLLCSNGADAVQRAFDGRPEWEVLEFEDMNDGKRLTVERIYLRRENRPTEIRAEQGVLFT